MSSLSNKHENCCVCSLKKDLMTKLKSKEFNRFLRGACLLILFYFALMVFMDEASAAVVRSGFENKMAALQSKFTGVILPLMSVFGLLYAGILAASGNEGARGRMILCILGSIVGFLSPYIIGWLQGILG